MVQKLNLNIKKIYMFYKIKNFFWPIRMVIRKTKNVIRWIPVIWRDENWDGAYLYSILEFKIQNMMLLHKSNMTFVGSEFVVRDMNICIKLLKKLEDNFYENEPMDYYEFETKSIPSDKKNLNTLSIEIAKENFIDYENKYPRSIKVAKEKFKKNRKYYVSDLSDKDIRSTICQYAGMERKEKAKKLLFRILNEKIDQWWD